MRKMNWLIVIALGFLLMSGTAYTAYTEEEDLNGRYQIYVVEIDKKPEPFLLDTHTGKIWRYVPADGFGKENLFKGLSVEGLVYRSKDAEKLDQQLSEWGTAQLINNNIKGYKAAVLSEFSYSLDITKARKLNKQMELIAKEKRE